MERFGENLGWRSPIFPILAWPSNKFGEFWAPSHPGQRKPQGRLRVFYNIYKSPQNCKSGVYAFFLGVGLGKPSSPQKKLTVSSPPNTNYPNLPTKFPPPPPQKMGGGGHPSHPGQRWPQGIWGVTAQIFPRALPKGFWTTKSAGLTTLNLPYGCVWPGWPKIPKSYWEARPKENHRENGGGLQPRFFPKPLHNEVWKKTKVSFFSPRSLGRALG